ncbi:unnamed protein product [Rhizoctonia solani]|uniref:Peptidase C14 caspase domain-containing protein n=1 Tax=Rhizoctonia solani TaxID=456999 RepID=A0A8H3DQX3_9AGAM|nr:unnamed protein product [Rhizoctonia solani]
MHLLKSRCWTPYQEVSTPISTTQNYANSGIKHCAFNLSYTPFAAIATFNRLYRSSSVSLPTQTGALHQSALPGNNTQYSATAGLATSPSTRNNEISYNPREEVLSDEEVSQDAPKSFEDIQPQSSPIHPIDGGVESESTSLAILKPVAIEPESSHESSTSAASPTSCESFLTPPSIAHDRVQADSAPSTGSILASSPRSPQKKALLIGLNYEQCDKEKHLRHAASDAQRFAAALTKLGYSTENTRVVTDEGQSSASREYLLGCMDWLIDGASEGDHLFFMFSGHCLFPHGEKEPQFLAADTKSISRSTFHERLVSKVPAGAELNVVLDCCHAAGMVKLKYRTGQMVPELAASPDRSVPLNGSLHGLDSPRGPALSVQTTPVVMMSHTPAGTPTSTQPRRGVRGGIAAAPLLSYPATPNQAPAPVLVASPIGKQPGPAQRRQLVVQGYPLGQFQARQDGFVSPAGKVIVWAGTGERLKAFEASGGVESGIVTNAFCGALEKCHDSITTRGALWKSLVGAISGENRCRRERDAKKPKGRNIPMNTRLQLAELWVSQKEPLSFASPILNQAVEYLPLVHVAKTGPLDSAVIDEGSHCNRGQDARKPAAHNIPLNRRLQLWVSQEKPVRP